MVLTDQGERMDILCCTERITQFYMLYNTSSNKIT